MHVERTCNNSFIHSTCRKISIPLVLHVYQIIKSLHICLQNILKFLIAKGTFYNCGDSAAGAKGQCLTNYCMINASKNVKKQ